MSRRITTMSAGEIAALPKATRDRMFREEVVYAITQSVQYKNCSPAKSLLKCLPFVNKRTLAKQALIEFLETWGNLSYDKAHDDLRHARNHEPDTWTLKYEEQIKASDWDETIEDANPTKTIHDADKEFRTLLTRLKKVAEDPEKTLLHSILLAKIEEVILAYGRTDAKSEEEKRGRTLFDASTRMKTMRAGIYAKGS